MMIRLVMSSRGASSQHQSSSISVDLDMASSSLEQLLDPSNVHPGMLDKSSLSWGYRFNRLSLLCTQLLVCLVILALVRSYRRRTNRSSFLKHSSWLLGNSRKAEVASSQAIHVIHAIFFPFPEKQETVLQPVKA